MHGLDETFHSRCHLPLQGRGFLTESPTGSVAGVPIKSVNSRVGFIDALFTNTVPGSSVTTQAWLLLYWPGRKEREELLQRHAIRAGAAPVETVHEPSADSLLQKHYLALAAVSFAAAPAAFDFALAEVCLACLPWWAAESSSS